VPIRVSGAIRSSLPTDERPGLEDFLWKSSGARCFLCRGEMNVAAETLVADHDDPVREGGAASRENLNLAHEGCNSFKRDYPTLDVRPFLQLRRAMEDLGGLVNYGDCAPVLKIKPGPTKWEDKGDKVEFSFSDGSKRVAEVFTESAHGHDYRYTFTDVPRAALHNDNECQPRTIKLNQLWKIYSDLHINPLHEPPSVRLISGRTAKGGGRMALFDGQHKTLASWLDKRDRVIVKVYLNLDTAATIQLVNSIQATIPKLPLSTFELAAKMDEETSFKLKKYLEEKDSGASEAGFIDWLPRGERDRGRQGFRLGLAKNLIDRPDLRLMDFVQRAGAPKDAGKTRITETAFKGKVLDKLLHKAPLKDAWQQSSVLREREMNTIGRSLNLLSEFGFEIDPSDPVLVEKRRRMLYQSALAYIATLIRRTIGIIMRTVGERELMEKEPTEEEWQRITDAIKLLVDHPIWTADLNATEKTRRVRDAFSKNQDAEDALRDAGLTPGYLVGDKLPANWDS
jgi:hypothetical protein